MREIAHRMKEVERIRHTLERLHSPRLQMMLIVALTGAVGFLSSVALLYAGVHSMWLRYPLAVISAYGAFLFFLWCWLRAEWSDTSDLTGVIDPAGLGHVKLPDIPWSGAGGQFGGGGASGAFGGSPDVLANVPYEPLSGTGPASEVAEAAGSVLDAEEFAVIILVIVALFSAAGAAAWIVWMAPGLFAELMLDAAIATGLYRRLRGVGGDHWLRTAIKRTAFAFAGVAILFAIAGAAMQAYSPASKTMGHVLRVMKQN